MSYHPANEYTCSTLCLHMPKRCQSRVLISSRTQDSVDPISSVSHVILTQVSTGVFVRKKWCYRYIRKKKTVGGLNPGHLILHTVALPLSY